MSELLPCPFCGGEAAIFQGSDENQHTVRCVQCAIKMPIMLNREGAIAAWNSRSDAVPVVRGEWVKKSSEEAETLALCSKCSYPISWWHKTKYCPNCGAKMEVEP
jgi:Lar family restriction alleviation protein